jgi:Rrf2 family iron-sulfur cluster assembly transcriptional regulator
MLFSKSFGYAIRSVLYVATVGEDKARIPLTTIASDLNIPRHFLGKVMKRLVKEGVISSQKGPNGGFFVNDKTLATSLIKFVEITGESAYFETCVLRMRRCNPDKPCPLHYKAEGLRAEWRDLFSSTTVKDLLKKDEGAFIDSLSLVNELSVN